MEQLTVKEALEQGYSLAVYNEQEWQGCVSIKDIKENDFIESEKYHNGYILCDKEPSHYGFSEDQIENIITEEIYNQDEYDDENEDLAGIALEGCDELLKQLTEKINENLSKKDFYFQTTIKLVP